MTLSEVLLRAALRPVSALPRGFHIANAKVIAFLMEKIVRYRRDDIMINLGRAFPELDYLDIKRIRSEFYLHFADVVAQTVWLGGCRKPERLRKAGIVTIKNPELLAEIDTKPGGCMFLCSHCGNWELLGGLAVPDCFAPGKQLPFTEANVCVSYKRMSSKAWNNVMRDNRFAPLDKSLITGYIETRTAVRYIMSHRDEKKYYHMITDQRPYLEGADKVKVEFLGLNCGTMSAAAALAKKSELPVIFLKMKELSRWHYEIEYIPICSEPQSMSVQEIMDEYYRLLSAEIREQPFNYLWSHRRWSR